MSITNSIQVRAEGNLNDTVQDSQLKPHIESAAIELKKVLGLSLYRTIESESQSSDDEKIGRYEVASKAEACMALSFAVHALNIETSGAGIVSEKGFGDSRSKLLNRNEVTQLAEYYNARAMSLLAPYIPASETTVDEDSTAPDSFRGANYKLSAI